MNKTYIKLKISCHCGSIKMELLLPEKIDKIIRCNCSICSKNKGFGMICIPSANLYLIKGQESMTEYFFNTMEYPHNFVLYMELIHIIKVDLHRENFASILLVLMVLILII